MTRRRYVCPRCNREAWAVRILRMCPALRALGAAAREAVLGS